jgi:hypothetical protein
LDPFTLLTLKEQEFLLEVPVLLTFLIAGADNDIDQKERHWAERLLEFRSEHNEPALLEYYNELEKTFEKSFQKWSAKLMDVKDRAERNRFISEELKKAGALLKKLDSKTASELYESFRSFARQIAMSSGGFLGFGSISHEEAEWLELKMIEKP